jgi:hypothetical protein
MIFASCTAQMTLFNVETQVNVDTSRRATLNAKYIVPEDMFSDWSRS